MKKSTFLRHTLRQLAFLFLLSGVLISCNSVTKQEFAPVIGICTGVNNAELLASHGYGFIEAGVQWFLIPLASDEEFAVKLAEAEDSPIPILACNGFLPGRLKSVGPDAAHDKILEYAETAFKRAQMVGVEVIVFGSGGSRSVPEGFSHAEAREQFIALCKALGPIAKKYDVTLTIEPLNTREVNFINTMQEGADIVKAVGHPNIMLLADVYHMLMEDEGPEEIIRYGHLIKHVHVAEKQGRAAPGTHNEDFSPYYKALREVGYTGLISIEAIWEDMSLQLGKAIETIQSQL